MYPDPYKGGKIRSFFRTLVLKCDLFPWNWRFQYSNQLKLSARWKCRLISFQFLGLYFSCTILLQTKSYQSREELRKVILQLNKGTLRLDELYK